MKLNFKEGKANKIHIFVDGEYKMTADRDYVFSLPYRENCEIDDRELSELERLVSKRRAFNKAVDLLSRRDHSSGELVVKLCQKGFCKDDAKAAAQRLEELGYVDDLRFAKTYAAELVRLKGFGKRRVVTELMKKGVASDTIDEALCDVEFESERLEEVIRKKYLRNLDDKKGLNRAINGLLRMGYGYGEIKDALCKIEEEIKLDYESE